MARTNGELELMLEGFREHVTSENQNVLEKIEGTRQQLMVPIVSLQKELSEVKEQTTQHNGRMTKGEKWQEQVKGGAKAFGVVAFIILGLIGFIFNNLNSRLDRIDNRLTEATSNTLK